MAPLLEGRNPGSGHIGIPTNFLMVVDAVTEHEALVGEPAERLLPRQGVALGAPVRPGNRAAVGRRVPAAVPGVDDARAKRHAGLGQVLLEPSEVCCGPAVQFRSPGQKR